MNEETKFTPMSVEPQTGPGNNEVTPPTQKPKFSIFKSNRLGWGLVVAVLILGAATAAAIYYKSQQAPRDEKLAIVSASPQGETYDYGANVSVVFNHPVSAHSVQEFIEFQPQLNGEFEHSSNPNEVIFNPEADLPPATLVTVRVKSGLMSENGKKLEEDYYFTFTTKPLDNSITFTQAGISAKFMSFHADRGVDLDVTVGAEVVKPNARMFRVTSVDTMLESLRYKTPGYPQVYNNYGEYIETPVDTSKLEMVKDISDVAQIKKFSFREKPGLYVVEARDGDKVLNTVWISLSNIGVHFRQDDQNVFFAAQNLNTGVPEQNVDLSIYSMMEKPKLVQNLTVNGIASVPYKYPKTVDIAVAKKGDAIMVIPVSIPNSQADIRVYNDLNSVKKIFLYTERPIYQPGEKLYFRGLVRIDNDAIYKVPPAGTKVRILMQNGSQPSIEQTVTTLNDGTFFGELILPTDTQGNQYLGLQATTDTAKDSYESQGYASFEVLPYVKPDFGLEVIGEKTEYIRGDKAKATILGKYFNGNVMANEKVTYSVYSRDYYETEKAVYNQSFSLNGWGGMCGGGFGDDYYGDPILENKEVSLDKNGKAQVEFSTADLPQPYSKEIVFVAQKKDANNNNISSAATSIVHAGDFNIFFRPSKNAQVTNGPFTYAFYAETFDGRKLTNEQFRYSLVEVKYEDNKQVRNEVFGGNVKTNQDGVGIITGKYPGNKELSYEMVVSSKDSKGNNIENSSYVYLTDKVIPSNYDNTVLNIQSVKNNYSPRDTIELDVESPADLKVFTTFERGRVYDSQWTDIKKGKSKLSFKVADNYTPSITPTFSFFYNGGYYIEGLSLNVPALNKVLNIDVQTSKPTYKVGETAVVTIKTRDSKGNPVPAKVGVGVVDKAIFALRKNATQPIHSSFYYFRARSTNASSSLTWIKNGCECGGGGGGGGEDGQFGADVDVLNWSPNVQTGADGTAVIEIPVGSSETTWKILTYGSTNSTDLGQGDNEFLVTK